MSKVALCILLALAAAAMPSHAFLKITTKVVFVNNGKICHGTICFECYWLRDICLKFHKIYPSVCHDYVQLCTYTGRAWYFSNTRIAKNDYKSLKKTKDTGKTKATVNTKTISKSTANRLSQIKKAKG